MSKKQGIDNSTASPGRANPPAAQAEQEPPATLGQKIFIVVLYLYVASLVWLVLSHHWYGVLPTWLDPH
jgi:uncharacterized ion transporter superfamily protein YfcC